MNSDRYENNKGNSFRMIKKQLSDIREEELLRSDLVKKEIHDNILRQVAVARHKKLIRKIYIYSASAAAISLILLLIGTRYFSSTGETPFNSFAAQVIDGNIQEISILSENGSKYKIENNSQIICDADGNITIKGDKNSIEINDNSTFYKVVIPQKKRASIALMDGSQIVLNSGSTFTFPKLFTNKERNVYLNGEGFFKVQKNKVLEQFKVMTPKINICVLGTEFNVSSTSQTTEVVLVNGMVAIESQSGEALTRLKPGEMFSTDYQTYEKQETETYSHTCWVENIMLINDLPLSEVVNKISEYYNTGISIVDTSGNKTINGKLDLTNDIEEIVKTLSDISGAKLSISDQATLDSIYNK